MIKLALLFFGFLPFGLHAMEERDQLTPSEWRSRRLQTLLEESKWPTCNQWNQKVREAKAVFVQKYLEKYDDQQAILSDLLHETQGVICATADSELAQADSNKFLCVDPLQCTADEIDARWQRIHHADCKNMGLKTSEEKNQEVKESRGPLHDIPGMLPPS